MIHPTAIIHPGAKLDSSVRVGPYAVIDEHVEIGSGCILGPHVYLTGHTTIGAGNQFHAGCVIGDAPQDLKYRDEPTGLRIGSQNVFREHANVHRSSKVGEFTVVGSNNFLMANSHIGHNVTVGNYVIISNGALVAGHASIADRVFLSGNCLVHQFVRVGTLALMQGGSAISKDLPPYCFARGDNHICGLNVIGLRRAGIDSAERLELKAAYRLLFRSRKPFQARLDEARTQLRGAAALAFLDFASVPTKRGLCTHFGSTDGEGE